MKNMPRVSCLMVSANRKKLVSRAINCFLEQSYDNKELVIVDDGEQDYSSLISNIPKSDVKYIRLTRKDNVKLGQLRNVSIDAANGDFMIQWDDDDWYHPDRIKIQSDILQKGFDACCLSSSLTHIQINEFEHLPFIGSLNGGIPGSIMHIKDKSIRYPNHVKGEDSEYLNYWKEKECFVLPASFAYLFIRCYHGGNTWDLQHFKRRMRNSPRLFLTYFWYRYCFRDLSKNPHFNLQEKAAVAFEKYLLDSQKLEII